MKNCKKFEFPAIKNWDKYSHLLGEKSADTPSSRVEWYSIPNNLNDPAATQGYANLSENLVTLC